MTLQEKYKQYLAKPTEAALSTDASIHYIPTLSTFTKPQGILKHLDVQGQQLKVKANFLNVIEGDNALCVETESTIQFLLGGSAYLPGLDDNFLADRTVTLPITHIVEFDAASKIHQIRLVWDQASLLKSVEVIGTRARNWPIHDGQDQARLIASSISHVPHTGTVATKPTTRRAQNGGTSGNLSLFEPREFERIASPRNAVSPRELAKPPPRAYDELFGDDEPRSPSPTKGNQFKAGAGENFQPNRLFDEQAQYPSGHSQISVKTNPTKFDHFDMNETSVQEHKTNALRSTKQAAHWDFADFATPQKVNHNLRDRNERTVNWSPDEAEARKPEVKIPYRPAPRKDAAPHFNFNDNTPPADKRTALKENVKAKTAELYHDPVLGTEWTSGREDKKARDDEPAPLGNITNGARKNFTSHFDMTDASPTKKPPVLGENQNPTGLTGAKKAGRNMLATSWDFYDNEPVVEKGIKIAGDGMGNRKTTEKSWWELE